MLSKRIFAGLSMKAFPTHSVTAVIAAIMLRHLTRDAVDIVSL